MPRPAPPVDASNRARLLAGAHATPHDVLGAHPGACDGASGTVIRAFHPDAVAIEAMCDDGRVVPLEPDGKGGLFVGFVAGVAPPLRYRLRLRFGDGNTWERDDPYRFLPTLGDVDLHLLNEGTHRRLGERLGARPLVIDGVRGTAFAVWAPSARRVSVVGDFCRWDGRLFPMRQLGASGVFEIFVPGVEAGAVYKYEILTPQGTIRLKTDPLAAALEHPPRTASRVVAESTYAWGDAAWMDARRTRDWTREPITIYEVHLGSWARVPEEGNRPLTYREIAPRLAEHARRLGFTHVELLPVMEHPFDGSWGYQVSGYFAPTSRFGTPDDFRFFVDTCHQAGIGVLLDWVPAHFPRDDWALRRFDGTALYEHEDPREGEHPDWGTLIFNYGRSEVRSFLVSNAVHWCRTFHADGLRVDAVASMLYRDYSRRAGQWIPNRYGGRENLEAIALLREVSDALAAEAPGAMTIAEESTAWPGVTRPVRQGGLGFTFKWNMGWMHDTLFYFALEPVHRKFHQNDLTFAMLYETSERFVNPLSHDEVVHGKRSLLEKMPGDLWQKLANLRTLLAYQYTRPGKVLLFMGTELASHEEWNHDASLPWHLADDPARAGLQRFLADLARLYRERACLWRVDPDPDGFRWIDCTDRDQSIVSYVRRDGDAHLVVVLNLTPVPRSDYRIGSPASGAYVELLSSDDRRYGGSGYETRKRVVTEPVPLHGFAQSMRLALPPLGALVLGPES
ncbi:MAG TPA: 1,4-alpha-glucan branching protein GlgB [Candidatus Eisenbacteria bacterium]|nr:1,4-alpha-glucan branching protein GlgB [Candidatus Eisenbacteria bacterium]